ncbi:MAG: YtxH domain-containing protein [Terriglobales bacterium]
MSDHEDYQPADRSLTGIAVAFFLVGAAVGAGIALLVAPQSGKQTRRMLQRRYEDAADAVAEKAEAIRERGREMVDDAKEKVAEAREKIAPFAKRSS